MIDSRKKRPREVASAATPGPSAPTASPSLFHEDRATVKTKTTPGPSTRLQSRLTHAQLRELEAEKEKEVSRGWARAQDLWSGMLTSMHGEEPMQEEREWLIEAERLVETFRETRNLFLTSRVSRFVPLVGCFLSRTCRTCPSGGCFQGVKLPGNSKQKQRKRRLRSAWHQGYILILVCGHRIQTRGIANPLMQSMIACREERERVRSLVSKYSVVSTSTTG